MTEIRTNAVSGRGVYAIDRIPKDSQIDPPTRDKLLPSPVSSSTPFAYVILRKFRKEVCGWCFAYSWDTGQNKWNVRRDDLKGIWFCSDDCLSNWIEEYRISANNTVVNILETFEKTYTMKPTPKASMVEPKVETLEDLERLWSSSVTGKFLPHNLVEEELNMARFVLQGLIQCLLPSPSSSVGTWEDLLTLQSSEQHLLDMNMNILAIHVRVYQALRYTFLSHPELGQYLATPDVTRTLLLRHHSNAFGIWEQQSNDKSGAEGEMLGYGLWVGGGESMFNHDCTPNIQKRRYGRTLGFFAKRDIEAGEQLCTNYVDINQNVQDRRKELLEWGFLCACTRCELESS
ncbi:hypothetical protein DL96DRAFT_1576647, partial [Flagelloscypha sp. PMI_526]